ncbi:MAG: tyrosine-type recombinase/integrase [Desulfobulbaceae bacterium]|nr:tyrosine-type recombinase/integrase [Desulfobulbaceae bacterium]
MRNKPHFCSILSGDILFYLDFKRAIGRKFNTEEATLRLFDRFIFDYPVIDSTDLTPLLIESFLTSRVRTRPRSYNHLLGVLRCFFSWMVIQGRLTHSPVQARPRRVTSRLLPFLFKPEQVQRILEITAQLPDNPRALHRKEVYSLIFRLMYGLGLRVGEIVRLCHKDIDRKRRLLVIRETKFGKNRLVPFGPKQGEHIKTYLFKRLKWYGQWQPDDPLFSFTHNRPLRPETISHTFHQLLPKIELTLTAGTAPPCLHCLRHSFAVQTLLRWYRSGIDPGQRLFHLSTFMGHSDPASTSWYLTVTDELFAEASKRFERLVGCVCQEVNL